jgi:hypothetical protein
VLEFKNSWVSIGDGIWQKTFPTSSQNSMRGSSVRCSSFSPATILLAYNTAPLARQRSIFVNQRQIFAGKQRQDLPVQKSLSGYPINILISC